MSYNVFGDDFWNLAVDLDYTAQTTQNFLADQVYTIGGYAHTTVNHGGRSFGIVNGTGIEIYPSAAATDFFNPSANSAPWVYVPLSVLIPGFFYPISSVRVWVQSAISGVDQNFERAISGILKQSENLQFKYGSISGNNPSLFRNDFGMLLANALISFSGTYNQGSTALDVSVITLTPGAAVLHAGTYSGGWPAASALSYQSHMSISFNQQISDLAVFYTAYNTSAFANMTYDVKRLKVEFIREVPP